MAKLKKIAIQAENNEFIYVPKRVRDHLNKKVIITKQSVVGGAGGKLVIEYRSKRYNSHGKIELYDMGSDENKI